jgi:hypothetical protein
MQPIVVSPVRVSFSDYRQLYFKLTSRSLLWLLLPVAVVVGLIFALSRVKLLATPWFWGPPLLLVIGSVVAGLMFYLGRIRRTYEASPLAAEALSYHFDQKRFTVSGSSSAALEVPWGTVTEAQRHGPWLLLLTAAPATHIVDLRQVQAPATEAALLSLLQAKGIVVK